jgi:hypothetical protein
MMRRLLCGTLAVTALTIGTTAAQARNIVHPPLQHPGMALTNTAAQSTNWSGYATTVGTFTNVIGSWTVPAVTCARRETSYSSFWVGLDGYNSGTVEQLGTDSDCSNGQPQYYAWYELYPRPSQGITNVSPGDTLTASVNSASPTSYTLTITDTPGPRGRRWSATGTLSTPADARSSAEWVAEAPSSCGRTCSVLPLSNFGTVNFTGAQATSTSPLTGPISAFTFDTITMVTGPGGPPKAIPGPLTAGGSAFSVTWAHA